MKRIKGDLSDFGILLTPAPRVQVLCYIPRLNFSAEVDFMIDTGASETCLNGGHALGLQRYMRKETLYYSSGIGGQCGYYEETALLIFTDTTGQLLDYELELGIQCIRRFLWRRPSLLTLRTPCLLGHDVLSKWELRYNHQKEDITLIAP